MKKYSIHILSLALVALLAACSGTSKLDRSVVPQAGPAPKIQLGDYSTFTLENGLKVIVVENHKLPRVSYQLTIDRDPLLELGKAGMVSMTGDLLGSGTAQRSKAEIDEAIDFIGASLSTSSNGIFGASLKKHSEALLKVFAEVLLSPSFPEDEIEKLRKQQISGLASAKTSANAISANISSVMTYGKDHPYGELETEETIGNVTREDLLKFYNTYFKPNISYLVVVGDITADEARAQAEKYFGGWKKSGVPKHNYAQPAQPEGNRVCFVPLQGAVQSVINITYPVDLKVGSPDAIPASVMNSILGGGVFSGRLMQNLREDKAYTYGARSSLNPDKIAGSFEANASVRNEVTDSAIVQFLYELERMIKEPVADSTLSFVKNGMNGSFARSLESPQTIARFALNIERYGLPKDYYNTYLEKLAGVSVQDIQAMAAKYIKPGNAFITVVGNREEVAGKLGVFAASGEVELYDMYGEPWKDIRPAPEGVTAQSVLENYVKAVGGVEKLKAVKSFSQKGSFAAGPMVMEMTQKMKDNSKFVMEIGQTGMIIMKQVYDGSKGSNVQLGMPAQAMTEEDIKDLKMQIDLLAELNYDKYGIKAELKGIDKVEGKDAYVLEVTKADGSMQSDYYDVSSGLKIQSLVTEETPMGAMTTTTLVKSYRDFDGIKMPDWIQQMVGPQTVDIKISEVQFNVKLPDSDFKVD